MLFEKIQETAAFLRSRTILQPRFGIVLGTGLSNLSDEISVEATIAYRDIPHFPVSTVESHKGQLIFGWLEGQPVVVMAGRFHYYEGYSMQEVTFPIRVLKELGIETLLLTNAAGGTNPAYQPGDLVIVKDHINLHPENPLRGPNDERLGPRFPDLLDAYDKSLIDKALAAAYAKGIRAHMGVYVGLPGPNLETPAEYEFVHRIGGDLVGMSTVPEVIVARHAGLRVFVLSVVTNACYPVERIRKTTVEAVIAVAKEAEPKMSSIIRGILKAN